MFRIEELLDLFRDDTEVIKIILSSYLLSQRENKELSDSVFQQLLFLKQIQPNIHIKIKMKTTEDDCKGLNKKKQKKVKIKILSEMLNITKMILLYNLYVWGSSRYINRTLMQERHG